jgi:hypothetical protein
VKAVAVSLILCASFADPAAALQQQDARPGGATSSLTACRAIADSAERLACYDNATDNLIRAEQAGELVVMDRDDVRQTRRSLFGFSLPRIALFGGRDDDDDKRADVEDVDRLETTIRSARQNPLGKWILVMEDGAVWNQTDTRRLSRDPAPGMSVAIRKAAIGSFFANIDRQVAIRVQRQQ